MLRFTAQLVHIIKKQTFQLVTEELKLTEFPSHNTLLLYGVGLCETGKGRQCQGQAH